MNTPNIQRSITKVLFTAIFLAQMTACRVDKVHNDDHTPKDKQGEWVWLKDKPKSKKYTYNQDQLSSFTVQKLAYLIKTGDISEEVAKQELFSRLGQVKSFFQSQEWEVFLDQASVFEILAKLDMFSGHDAQRILTGWADLEKVFKKKWFPAVRIVDGQLIEDEVDYSSSNWFFLEDGRFVTCAHCVSGLSSDFSVDTISFDKDIAYLTYSGDETKLPSKPVKNKIGAPIVDGDVVMSVGYDDDAFGVSGKKMLFSNTFRLTNKHVQQITQRWKDLWKDTDRFTGLDGCYGFIVRHPEANKLSGMSGSPVLNTKYEAVGVISAVTQIPKFSSFERMLWGRADEVNYFLVCFAPIESKE